MPLAATGSLNGTLAIWDVPSQKLRHSCAHPVSCNIRIAFGGGNRNFWREQKIEDLYVWYTGLAIQD